MLLCIEGIQFEGMQIAFMPTRKEIWSREGGKRNCFRKDIQQVIKIIHLKFVGNLCCIYGVGSCRRVWCNGSGKW